jgi:hypothetical protein
MLAKMVKEYPFMIRSHALKPITAFHKIKLWEDLLFSEMPDEDAQEMRKKKTVEISKLEEEEIPAEIDRIKKTIEGRSELEEQEQDKVAHFEAYTSVLAEIKQIGHKKAAQKRKALRKKMKKEMETGEIEPSYSPLPVE